MHKHTRSMDHWARITTLISRSEQSRLPTVAVHPRSRLTHLSRAAKRGMWIKGELQETPAEYKKRHAAGDGTTGTTKGK